MLIMLLVSDILAEQAAPQTACNASILGLKAQILYLNNASSSIYTCSEKNEPFYHFGFQLCKYGIQLETSHKKIKES